MFVQVVDMNIIVLRIGSQFGMPYFQGLPCSKTTFINDRSIFKVNSVIVVTWGMTCNLKVWTFGSCFDISEINVLFFWCQKLGPFLQCSTTDNWHRFFWLVLSDDQWKLMI